jgi:hypothetical protein
MTKPYTYKITETSDLGMVIEYKTQGHDPIQVAARLPFQGENIADVIHSYAPLGMWEVLEKTTVIPDVGIEGEYIPPVPVELPLPETQPTGAATLTPMDEGRLIELINNILHAQQTSVV